MVLYNVTSKIYELNATPFEVWVLAAILGVILFLLSLRGAEDKEDALQGAIISFIAWVPIGFTALTSFAVDKMTGVILTSDDLVVIETHTVYSFDLVGYLFGLFLIAAIVNTFRLVALHRSFDTDTGSPRFREEEDQDEWER